MLKEVLQADETALDRNQNEGKCDSIYFSIIQKEMSKGKLVALYCWFITFVKIKCLATIAQKKRKEEMKAL